MTCRLGKSLKSFSSCNTELTLSLLMKTPEAFVGNVDQDQTAHSVQSDLLSTLSTFSFKIIAKLFYILQ